MPPDSVESLSRPQQRFMLFGGQHTGGDGTRLRVIAVRRVTNEAIQFGKTKPPRSNERGGGYPGLAEGRWCFLRADFLVLSLVEGLASREGGRLVRIPTLDGFPLSCAVVNGEAAHEENPGEAKQGK